MEDPSTVFFSADTRIEKDVKIQPNVYFGAGVIVKDNVLIKSFTHLENTIVNRNVMIGPFSRIRDNVEIGSGVYIGKNSKIEESTIIYPNVSIYHDIEIGSFCIIHSGSVLGSDGLGFAKENGEWFKIEHLGKVILGTKVELGANCSIDRGSVGNTLLGNNLLVHYFDPLQQDPNLFD